MKEKDLYMLIKMLLLENGNMSETAMAQKVKMSQANFNRKLKAGTLKFLEVQEILNALGYTVYAEKDGKKIELK